MVNKPLFLGGGTLGRRPRLTSHDKSQVARTSKMKLQDVHQILSMFAPKTVTFETLTVNLFQVENWNVRNKENNNYKIYSFSHNHALVESGCCIWKVTTIERTHFLLNHDYGREGCNTFPWATNLCFTAAGGKCESRHDLSRLPLGKNHMPCGPGRP